MYAPTREAEGTPPDEPGDAGDAGDNGANGHNGDDGDDNNGGDGHEDGQDDQKGNDDVEEITEESTHLALAEGWWSRNHGTHEPMDVVDEVPTAHAAVVPKEEIPELKALGVVESTPEKLAMPHFAKALTMHPSKYIDLNSDDDNDPSELLDQTQLRLQ